MEWVKIYMMTIPVDKRIAHLTIEQIEEVQKRYYNGESIQVLKHEYHINILDSHFITIFPPILSQDKCPYCNRNFFIKMYSRRRKKPYPYNV